jgi:hypothetical protein
MDDSDGVKAGTAGKVMSSEKEEVNILVFSYGEHDP